MEQQFTDLRSLVSGFANAMNLVSPEIQSHHQKVAYLAYRLAEAMGMSEDERLTTMYGALLHDIGSVVIEGDALTLDDIEAQAAQLANVAFGMLKSNAKTCRLADIVKNSQLPVVMAPLALKPSKQFIVGQVVNVADQVSILLREDEPVLNQLEAISQAIHEATPMVFLPKVADAFDSIVRREYIWMDLLYRPHLFLEFIPDNLTVSLDEAVLYTQFMSLIIDFRSPFTAMHSAGVSASACKLAELAGMSEDECKMMRIAGNLHDVGKLKIPKAILEKPGKLTDGEFNIIKEHAYFTYILLKDIRGFGQITRWAAYHHEKLSGSGYPFKLAERQVPFGARIMAVADVFSAITEERPYRKGMQREQVISILRENVEQGNLSATVVELLIAHFDEVNQVRDEESRRAGKRYFDSIGS